MRRTITLLLQALFWAVQGTSFCSITPAHPRFRSWVTSQLLVLALLFVVAGTTATLLVAVGAGFIGNSLRKSPAIRRWEGKAVGALYCALGVRLMFQQRIWTVGCDARLLT